MMKKRFLSFVLTLCMLLSLMPLTVFANAPLSEITIQVDSNGRPVGTAGKDSINGTGWTYILRMELKHQFTLESGYLFTFSGMTLGALNTSTVVYNYGTVENGNFSESTYVINTISGSIKSGNYASMSITNEGCISGGDFINQKGVTDNISGAEISGGTFNSTVTNNGSITNGTFNGTVINYGTITGGKFYGEVINYGSRDGGTYYNKVADYPPEKKRSFEIISAGGEILVKKNGVNITDTVYVGETYNLTFTQKPKGLYLLGENDPLPTAPYTVSNDFRPIMFGSSYDFTAPDEPVTLYAVFFDELLEISGGMGDDPFVFYQGEDTRSFNFEVNAPADNVEYQWSDVGLPNGLSVTKNPTDSSKAILTGIPTELCDASDVIIKVTATDTNGKKYYGELLIKVTVEEPYADLITLVGNASCEVPMATANTQAEVLDWLNDTWLPALVSGKRLHEYEKNAVIRVNATASTAFTAAIAGTSADTDGTDGALCFEIGTIADGTQEFTVITTDICTIKAAAYSHTHDWLEGWTADSDAHWHECEAGDCNITSDAEKNGYGAHSFNTAWSSDGTNHWHECTVCGYKKDTAAHTPGDAATETTPQKCTVCDYILAPATGHIKHTLTLVPETKATCTAEGNIAYYICSGCNRLFSDKAGESEITDRDSVIISMTPHEVSSEWSSDEDSHWKICGKCNGKIYEAAHLYSADCDSQCNECGYHPVKIKSNHITARTIINNDEQNHWRICDKCYETYDFAAHIYDSDTDSECDICKYKRTILTALNPGGGDIFFTPGDGVTLPDGAGIVTEPYTPVQGDLEAIGEALGGSLLQKTEYTVDGNNIRFWEPIEIDIKRYVVIGQIVAPINPSELFIIFNSDDSKSVVSMEFLSLTTGECIFVSDAVHFTNFRRESDAIYSKGKLTELSDIQITINGAEYVTKYSYVSDDLKTTTHYILYTPSGAPAGVLSVNENGSTSLRCNTGCDPESLKDTQTPSSGTISAGGKNYNMIPLMSNEIKISDATGAATPLAGTFTLTGTTSFANGTWLIAAHRNADGTYDIASGTVKNGSYSIPLSVTGQSPFMVFALVEQQKIEIPVTVIPTDGGTPQTGDSSHMLLWIALLFVSGGAVLAAVCRKRNKSM